MGVVLARSTQSKVHPVQRGPEKEMQIARLAHALNLPDDQPRLQSFQLHRFPERIQKVFR